MGKINYGRVLLCGLLAGVVLNIGEFVFNELIIGSKWEEAMGALNLEPVSSSAMVMFIVVSFLMGIGAMWLYAAIRPRFGAGPKTAVCAGLTLWFFVWLLGFGSSAIMGIIPWSIVLYSAIWGLFEAPLALVIGAWPYKEEE